MGVKVNKPTKRQIILALICGLLLILALVLTMFSSRIQGMLISQQIAGRWSQEGESYTQVSAYIAEHSGLAQTGVESTLASIRTKLDAEGYDMAESEDGSQLWTYTYSAEKVLNISSRYSQGTNAYATGVGGNFFLFYPVKLISGSYFSESDINQDKVVIDDSLAWLLFGATDVAGMEVYIGEKTYIISGVFQRDDDFATEDAYGELSHLFMSYDSMLEYDENTLVTCIQAVLPNPVSGFAQDVLDECLKLLVEEGQYALVNNTSRYSLASIVNVVGDFGKRSMRQVGLSLPYWENAARVVEDYSALMLVLIALCLVFPIVMLVRVIVVLWRRKKWSVKTIKEKAENKLEERREHKRYKRELFAPEDEEQEKQALVKPAKIQLDNMDDLDQVTESEYDINEIIRSVLEGEDEIEKDK